MIINPITLFVLFLELIPVIFVLTFIGLLMYKTSKNRTDLGTGELIFSWVFFAFYALTFSSIIVFLTLGKKDWALIGFIILALSIVALILIFFIGSALKKHKLKYMESHIVQGTLIGAVEKMSTSSSVTGREPQNKNYYALVFEYEDEGVLKTCTTTKLYTLPQIAYINREYKTLTLKAYKNICDIETNTGLAPTEYDLNDIKDLNISSTESIGSAIFYIEIIATLIATIPIFIITTLTSMSLWNSSTAVAIIILIIGILALVIPATTVIPHCYHNIMINKHGIEAFAVEFINDGITHTHDTYYNIKYTYKTDNGLKTKHERVTADNYGKVKNLKKLPIKVYKNRAMIDINKLP